MYTNDLASRRRTLEIPAKPEAGLAEWTSRIKALQKQVDDDEETETRRLEEEIAASRLARMRRSTGRGTSADLSNSDVAKALRETSTTPTPVEDVHQDKQQHQNDTLEKLTGFGQSQSSSHANRRRDIVVVPKPASSSKHMSLAEFMGGKATGPRLNKHAPQADSYDPDLFEQRVITAPHPVFGRGGIALPGMAGKGRASVRDDEESPAKPVTPSRDRKPSTPQESVSSVRTLVQNAEERRRAVAAQRREEASVPEAHTPRQRTISTPSAAPPTQSSAATPPWKREPIRDHSSAHNVRPTTPGTQASSPSLPRSGRHTPTRSTTPAQHGRVDAASSMPQARTPQPTARTPTPRSPATNPLASLAKPIQPTPRKSYQGPDIQLSQNSSPVYLRTPPSKEPTPSISRLQGRGFVQSMVKASSQIEPGPQGIPGSPSPVDDKEKTRDSPRKASVLDRWQFTNDSPPPIIAPKPVPLRKSRTVDPSLAPSPASPDASSRYSPPPPKVIKSDYTGKSLKSVASLPSIRQVAASHGSARLASTKSEAGGDAASPGAQKRGLGSSTTMISYIKPLKTGDNPPSSAPPSRPASAASRSRATSPEVDEMGIRVRSRTRSTGGAGVVTEVAKEGREGGAVGKPLSHPTKDRARKPKKAKTVIRQVPLKSAPDTFQDRTPENKAPSERVHAEPAHHSKDSLAKQSSTPETPVKNLLPGQGGDFPANGASRHVHFPLEVPDDTEPHVEKVIAPGRHTRIPSTGNRATVMDVAQALQRHEAHVRKLTDDTHDFEVDIGVPLYPTESHGAHISPEVSLAVGRRTPQIDNDMIAASPPLEKRKSSYEKYSAFVLPPLVEEKTPVQTPAGTLTRNAIASEPFPAEVTALLSSGHSPNPAPIPQSQPIQKVSSPEDKFIHFDHDDGPLPRVDTIALFNEGAVPRTTELDAQTISVEVMMVQGNTATAITRDTHVFYDAESLAIIHRSKAKSSGLVSTRVWAWTGNKCQCGEREAKKLQDLARRYNTSLITLNQYAEPPDLVEVLGGKLVIRQGLRAHWSSENTAMHLVRSLYGVVYIDELELSIKNLCSGFSYCLSLLETFYVWHGRGSTAQEREVALKYAQSLASSPECVIELVEGKSDQDEMFWVILGEGDYARADHWQWKAAMGSLHPRIWQVNAHNADICISAVPSIGNTANVHASVYILDCIWEFFVLIGSDGRGKRKDIRLALSVADELSAIAAPSRPFAPTVHVLVFPSQLPADLRLAFRDLDELFLNKGAVPDHMNLIPSALAFEHLQKTAWRKELLADSSMLPLGVQSIP